MSRLMQLLGRVPAQVYALNYQSTHPEKPLKPAVAVIAARVRAGGDSDTGALLTVVAAAEVFVRLDSYPKRMRRTPGSAFNS
jgi:hypothetical protein